MAISEELNNSRRLDNRFKCSFKNAPNSNQLTMRVLARAFFSRSILVGDDFSTVISFFWLINGKVRVNNLYVPIVLIGHPWPVRCLSLVNSKRFGTRRIIHNSDVRDIEWLSYKSRADTLVIVRRLIGYEYKNPSNAQRPWMKQRLVEIHFSRIMDTLPKCNVRLTCDGFWIPSNMVSDCHQVCFCGSCKSVK